MIFFWSHWLQIAFGIETSLTEFLVPCPNPCGSSSVATAQWPEIKRFKFLSLSWVRIPARYTGWIWHFVHIDLLLKLYCLFEETENKRKRGRIKKLFKMAICPEINAARLGYFLRIFATKFYYKSSPNIWQSFCLLLNNNYFGQLSQTLGFWGALGFFHYLSVALHISSKFCCSNWHYC